MPKFLTHLLLLCLFLACSDAPPAGEGDVPAQVEDTVVQDQIKHTRLSNPEALPDGDAGEVPDVTGTDDVALAEASLPNPTRNSEERAEKMPPNTAGSQANAGTGKITAAPARPAPAAPPATKTSTGAKEEPLNITTTDPPKPDHSVWDALLRKHVNGSGKVSYTGFRNDASQLNGYLQDLARERPDGDWPRNEALAYWINAYNAYTIKLILDNWPVKSIQDINEPWDQKWIELDGKSLSLNQIEHEIIRPTFKEPRIHFALVCAAKSCPPLANRAYTAGNLNTLLERQTKDFINNETFNVTQEEVVRVTPLFDWYGEDFGDVRAYLNKYVEPDIPAATKINFMEYDWSLNN